MDEWVWWMIAAGVLAVGEMATVSFFLGPIAVAAVLSAIVALAGAGLAAQWIVFIIASLGSLLVLRPIARRHLRTPAQIRTGTAALVGCPATVLERVDMGLNPGFHLLIARGFGVSVGTGSQHRDEQ